MKIISNHLNFLSINTSLDSLSGSRKRIYFFKENDDKKDPHNVTGKVNNLLGSQKRVSFIGDKIKKGKGNLHPDSFLNQVTGYHGWVDILPVPLIPLWFHHLIFFLTSW